MAKLPPIAKLRHKRYALNLKLLIAFFSALILAAAFYASPTDLAYGSPIRITVIIIGAGLGIFSYFVYNSLMNRIEIKYGYDDKEESGKINDILTKAAFIGLLAIVFFFGYISKPTDLPDILVNRIAIGVGYAVVFLLVFSLL